MTAAGSKGRPTREDPAASGQPERTTERGVPTVAFLGLFGVGNIGNEASLKAGIESVRGAWPEARLVCVCVDPGLVSSEHGIRAVPIDLGVEPSKFLFGLRPVRPLVRLLLEPLRWLKTYRFLRRTDVLLVPGTGILDDFGVRPWQMPFDLWRWATLTRLTRTRLVFMAVGAGPVHNRVSRALYRSAVGVASSCSYRDEGSRSFMASIGRDTSRDSVIPDIVFALGATGLVDQRERSAQLTVGIGVMAYFGWANHPENGKLIYERYMADMRHFAAHVLSQGHRIVLLVGEASDQRAIEDLLASLGEPARVDASRVHAPVIRRFEELLQAIQSVDVVVATRFHNVIAALMLNRPTISIGYAAKNRELLDGYGLGSFAQDVERLDVPRLTQQFERITAERARWTDVIARETRRRAAAVRSALASELGQHEAFGPPRDASDG